MNFFNEFFIMSGLIDIPEKKVIQKKQYFLKNSKICLINKQRKQIFQKKN